MSNMQIPASQEECKTCVQPVGHDKWTEESLSKLKPSDLPLIVGELEEWHLDYIPDLTAIAWLDDIDARQDKRYPAATALLREQFDWAVGNILFDITDGVTVRSVERMKTEAMHALSERIDVAWHLAGRVSRPKTRDELRELLQAVADILGKEFEVRDLYGAVASARGSAQAVKDIDKTINKILMSRLPADTKVEMIKAQRAKRRALMEDRT